MSNPVLHEINSGQGVKVSAAAKRYDDHPATWHRWLLKGLLMPDGSRLRLEAVMVGNTWFTSEPAIVRFISARTAKSGDLPAAPPVRTATQRRKASESAAAKLAGMGV